MSVAGQEAAGDIGIHAYGQSAPPKSVDRENRFYMEYSLLVTTSLKLLAQLEKSPKA